MLKRIITAIVALILFVPILVFSEQVKPLFLFAILFINIVSEYELLSCLGFKKNRLISIATYMFALIVNALVAAFVLIDSIQVDKLLLSGVLCLFVYTLIVLAYSMFSKGNVTFSKASQVIVFAFYVTLGLVSITLMRYYKLGNFYYLLIFIGSWMTDIGAYFVGSMLGKHKLIPQVSPKKTVEGAIGGILGAVIGFVVYGFIINKISHVTVKYLQLCVLAVVVAIISQIGDLIASFIKREYGIKDYGKIMPGHGGFLDRFDSIIAVAPIIFLAISILELGIFKIYC